MGCQHKRSQHCSNVLASFPHLIHNINKPISTCKTLLNIMSQFTCLTIQSFTVITVLKLQPNNFCTKFWRSSDLIKGLYQILCISTNKWVKNVEICLITFFCVFFFASLGKNVKKWGKLEEKHKSGYSLSALPFLQNLGIPSDCPALLYYG